MTRGDANPWIMVAEQEVLRITPLAAESVLRHAQPQRVVIIVPGSQVQLFRSHLPSSVDVIAEDDILPNWPISRIRQHLHRMPSRAGWYLQQFLKLGYSRYLRETGYVIWDADTVLLRRPVLHDNTATVFATARERHAPYFATFERLFGRRPVLSKSTISQYMAIDCETCRAMLTELEAVHQCDWVQAILAALPQKNASEFSEYETYANYLAGRDITRVRLESPRWFRYGTELEGSCPISLARLERRYRSYQHVAFERHTPSALRTAAAHILRGLRIGN